MSACKHPFTPGKEVLAIFRGDFRTWTGTTLALLVSLAVLPAPASAYEVNAEVKLYNTVHNQVGKARLTRQGDGSVAVHVSVHDLPPGFHGFHMHAIGKCTIDPGVAPFASAGGHFDLGMHAHGSHAGDFPVLLVQADGTAHVEFNTDRFALEALFDGDGSAIIIHANPDNYANIPNISLLGSIPGTIPDPYTGYIPTSQQVLATTLATGDAGGRIACGVVEKVVRRGRAKDKDKDRDKDRDREGER